MIDWADAGSYHDRGIAPPQFGAGRHIVPLPKRDQHGLVPVHG